MQSIQSEGIWTHSLRLILERYTAHLILMSMVDESDHIPHGPPDEYSRGMKTMDAFVADMLVLASAVLAHHRDHSLARRFWSVALNPDIEVPHQSRCNMCIPVNYHPSCLKCLWHFMGSLQLPVLLRGPGLKGPELVCDERMTVQQSVYLMCQRNSTLYCISKNAQNPNNLDLSLP